MPCIDDFMKEYLEHLESEIGCSKATIVAYRADIRQLASFLDDNDLPTDPGEVRLGHLRQWLVHMRGKGCAPATLSRRINALRSFFRYLEEMDHIGTQPTARLRQPRKTHRLPVCLTDDEAERLLNAAYEQHFTLVGFRDYAVIATLLFTGLRRSELLALRLEDVDLERGWIHVRKGKGRRQRRIPICAKLESAISDWLEFRPDVSHDSLFTDRQGRRFGKDGLYLSLKRCLKTARISKAGVSIHTLRHTFASSLIRAGVGVTEVQRLLGHADLATTGLYITIADDQLIDAVREHPLNVGAGWDDDG